MSRPPSLTELELDNKLQPQAALKQQPDYDCLPCRVMGSAAFVGLGTYTLWSGRKQLRERELEILRSGTRFSLGARRASIYAMSAGLVGLGVYRLVN